MTAEQQQRVLEEKEKLKLEVLRRSAQAAERLGGFGLTKHEQELLATANSLIILGRPGGPFDKIKSGDNS